MFPCDVQTRRLLVQDRIDSLAASASKRALAPNEVSAPGAAKPAPGRRKIAAHPRSTPA